MANIIKRVWNQNRMVQIEDLKGMTFQAEQAGHTFQISGIDDDGNTVALTGTPTGVLLRPDNTDVALTCSVSGGVVSATLPANCYDVPGRFGLTIFITSGSSKTAIYAAVGTVTRTSSGTVAPGTSQSVVDLINAINAAVNSIPASYSALLADIAPTYSNSALYSVGQYAWYDGDLKRCIVPITTAESYTAAHWTSAVLGQDVSDLKSAFDSVVSTEQYIDFSNTVSGTRQVNKTANIPAGLYFIHIDSVASSDTDNTTCRVMFRHSGTTVENLYCARATNKDYIVSLNNSVDEIQFYAANSYNESAGDTFTFSGFAMSSEKPLNIKTESAWDNVNNNVQRYNAGQWEIGGIDRSTGANYNHIYAIRNTGLVTADDDIVLSALYGFKFDVFIYSEGGSYIAYSGWITSGNTYAISKGWNYRIVVAVDYTSNVAVYNVNDILYKFANVTTKTKINSDYIDSRIENQRNGTEWLFDDVSFKAGTFDTVGNETTDNGYTIIQETMLYALTDTIVTIKPYFQIKVFYYDETGTYISKTDNWITGTYTIPSGSYYKVTMSKYDPVRVRYSVGEFEKSCLIISQNKSIIEFVKDIRGMSLEGKKVWWCGTSIPAGYPNAATVEPYPQRVGRILGCTVYNVAVPSSIICSKLPQFVSETNPYGFIPGQWETAVIGLDNSAEELTWLANHYSEVYPSWGNTFPADFEENKSTYLQQYINNYSFEGLLLPYLSTGSVGACDVYVFDHGRNDVSTLKQRNLLDVSAIRGYDKNTTDRTNMIGAMNHLIGLILADNPKARIIIVGHYTKDDVKTYVNDTPEVQEIIAEKMARPLVRVWDHANINAKAVGSTTVQKAWMPDEVHPGSDTTGDCNQHLANVIASIIKQDML